MKAVLLDFNGTLFDDTRFHVQAWRQFWHDRFAIDFTQEEVRRRFVGPGNFDIIPSVLGGGMTRAEIEALSLQKEGYYREIVRSDPANMRLVEGAEAFMDGLRARGVPFVVATASPIDNVEFYLYELGLDRWLTLDGIVYDDGVLAAKPDPAFYLESARRCGAAPGDCLVFEDSVTGIRAAVAAGVGRIVALDRTTDRARLEAFGEVLDIIHDFNGAEKYLY